MDTLLAADLDLDRFRLRRFLAELGPDELDTHAEHRDIAAVASLLDGNAKAVWFKKLGPEGAELVGNVGASRARIARAFGVKSEGLLQEVLRRLKLAPQIVEVPQERAPVQQVVETGAEIDLTRLPVHLHHGGDGGLYISASIDYSIDDRTQWTNVGFRRLMLRGRAETGADVTAPSDLEGALRARGRGRPEIPGELRRGLVAHGPRRRDDARAGRRDWAWSPRCAARRCRW